MNIEDIKEGETYNVRVRVIGKYGKCVDAIYADAADAIVGIHIPERRINILHPIGHKTTPKGDPNRNTLVGELEPFYYVTRYSVPENDKVHTTFLVRNRNEEYRVAAICECWNEEDAQHICDMYNAEYRKENNHA